MLDLPPFAWPWGREEELDSVQLHETRVLRRLRHLAEQNHEIIHRLKEIQMDQAQLDALVAEIGVDTDKMAEAGQEILAFIASLQSQGIDASGLVAAVQKLDEGVGSLASIAPPATPAQPEVPPAAGSPLPPADATPGGSSTTTEGDVTGEPQPATPDGTPIPTPDAGGQGDGTFAQNTVGGGDAQPSFVARLDGETYDDYVARAQAAGLTPADEALWNQIAPGAFA